MSHISCTGTNRFRSVVCPSHCAITVSLIMHGHHLFPKSCVSTSHFSVPEHARTPTASTELCVHLAVLSEHARTPTASTELCVHLAVLSEHARAPTASIHRAVCPSHCTLRTCMMHGLSRASELCVHLAVVSEHARCTVCLGPQSHAGRTDRDDV